MSASAITRQHGEADELVGRDDQLVHLGRVEQARQRVGRRSSATACRICCVMRMRSNRRTTSARVSSKSAHHRRVAHERARTIVEHRRIFERQRLGAFVDQRRLRRRRRHRHEQRRQRRWQRQRRRHRAQRRQRRERQRRRRRLRRRGRLRSLGEHVRRHVAPRTSVEALRTPRRTARPPTSPSRAPDRASSRDPSSAAATRAPRSPRPCARSSRVMSAKHWPTVRVEFCAFIS